MDRRQKRRILIFLLVPILAAILFLTDDPVIRIITVILIVVYVAFIIFLRDSVKFEERFSSLPDESLSGGLQVVFRLGCWFKAGIPLPTLGRHR